MVRHALTLLTALTLLFASGTAAAAEHQCGGSSMPSADCCCGHGSDADEAERQRTSELQGTCCELRAPSDSAPPAPPAALDRHAPEMPAPPALALPVASKLHRATVTFEGEPPPLRGPPLFVRHCRFLI